MNAGTGPFVIDPGLLARYRSAGARIRWRPARPSGKGSARRKVRIAHLHDEESRVEVSSSRGGAVRVAVDSGPVGALVLLLEVDARGTPSALGAAEAGRDASFPSGAIVAGWGGAPVPNDSRPSLADLVELARYALA